MGFWTLKEADTTDELDAIEEDVSPKLAAHNDAIMLDRRLYDRLAALDARATAGEVTLDAQAAWLLSEKLRDYRRLGVNLPEEKQATLRELNERIATLEAKWNSVVVAGRNAACAPHHRRGPARGTARRTTSTPPPRPRPVASSTAGCWSWSTPPVSRCSTSSRTAPYANVCTWRQRPAGSAATTTPAR